jgi:hypothetical protein
MADSLTQSRGAASNTACIDMSGRMHCTGRALAVRIVAGVAQQTPWPDSCKLPTWQWMVRV